MDVSIKKDKTKVNAEVPPVLRNAMQSRATMLRLPLVTVVAAALSWFVDHDAYDELPASLIDAKNLPDIPSNFPRTLTIDLSSELVDQLDLIVGGGRHGSDRSAVIRTALCSYLSACGMMLKTTLTSPHHLMNI
ncbi:MAG: ribbon-helix-helix domain-containing protein [Ilumatobacteraceae bacterium]